MYALDGTVVGYTLEDYNKALEAKYGRICTEKVEALRRQSPPFTNIGGRPVEFKECGTQQFWFHKGTEVASAAEWRALMCSDEVEANINTVAVKKLNYCGDRTYYFCGGKDQLSQNNYDSCVASNAEATCIADRETARTGGHKGKYGPMAGPGACGETRWICSEVMMDTEAAYEQSSCGKAASCTPRHPVRCERSKDPYWCACK